MPVANEQVSTGLFVASHGLIGSGIFAIVLGWVPHIVGFLAGIAAIVYYAICIWESHTMQARVTDCRKDRRARKIARLLSKQQIILAKLDALKAETVTVTTVKTGDIP